MAEQNSDRRVRIISQGYNAWRVQVLFSDTGLSATDVSNRLREVKAELASQFGMPDSLLEYKDLLSKKITRQGLLVQIRIVKQDIPKGAPQFHPFPLASEDGTLFSDMRIEATFSPFDEFDHPLTRQTVEARLKSEGFDLECVEWPRILDALQEMESTVQPIAHLEIGHGTPPGVGQSSRLTYGVPHHQERLLTSAWVGVRPVQKDEFLVEVSAATRGHTWGRNVYGRELDPRPGLSTRLVDGLGTKLVARDTQLVAVQDGLLVFERAGHDKRARDTCDLIPVKLSATVLPVTTTFESEVFDLKLKEPMAIFAEVKAGSRIHSTQALYIEGDVREGSVIRCRNSLRIAGKVFKADITCGHHLCVSGDVTESSLKADLTVQVDGHVSDSSLSGTDVIVSEISGGRVDALRQTSINRTQDTGGRAAAIRINLRKYLEDRQVAGNDALVGLHDSLRQIVELFGPEVALNVTEGSAQRLLLKWLQSQKQAHAPNYTHAEVQELRTVLEMIPLIRDQVKAIGLELRDITAKLADKAPEGELKP